MINQKIMKKLTALLFSIVFLTSFTACQKVEDWENQKTKATETTEETDTKTEEVKTEETTSTEPETTEDTETKEETPTTDSASTESSTETPAIEPTDSTEETASTQEIKTFNITAKQFEFTPNTISVNAEDKVVVNLTSEDVAHGFAVTEYNISEIVPAGTTKVIEFTADKKGTFTFKCPVDCGEGHMDMIGNLIVN